jgi:hypothetical protein
MTDRTWYSKSKADEVFATKAEVRALPSPDLSAYATKAEVSGADNEIKARIDDLSSSVATKAELADYAKTADVASVYATKAALAQAQLGGGGQTPDLSSYLTRSDASSTYVTKADAQATYPTKSEVASTYATKSELAQAGGGSPVPSSAGSPLAALPLRAGQGVSTVGFFGDSWSTESTMGQGFNLPSVVSRALGCVPAFSAVDGSGFGYSASGKDGFEVDSRVNAVCAAAPNLIVTIGSLNADKVIDNGDASGAAITEAVKAFVTKVRAKLPNVPIVVLGPQPSSVARLQSRSAHVNVKATKAGVEASGGLGNGVAFVDWLGVVDGQAVPWRDGRQCAEGDVVVYNGVAYRVTRAWSPAAGETPLTAGAPTVQVSDVLSGTGNAGAPKGDGTRDTLLLSDETHPTKIGAAAFGAAAAKRIGDAVASLASWTKAQGPVIPAAPAVPPTPPPPAQGDGLPIMAWLPGGWGTADRVGYSTADIGAVAALKPTQVALPIQNTLDADNAAVAIPSAAADKNQAPRKFSDSSLQGLRTLGIDVSGMVEAIDALEATGIEVLPNVRNGLTDAAATWYKSSDGKILTLLGKRVGKTYQSIHGRGQSKLRAILKTEYPAFTRVVDASDATADWMLTDTVKDAQKGILSAAKAGASVWRAAKTVFPDGVWALVESKDEQETAKSAAQAADVTIIGWAVSTPEALAAIKG